MLRFRSSLTTSLSRSPTPPSPTRRPLDGFVPAGELLLLLVIVLLEGIGLLLEVLDVRHRRVLVLGS